MEITEFGTRAGEAPAGGTEFPGGGSFARYMQHVPTAFVVTRGAGHALVYANAAFRRLTPAAGALALGSPVADAYAGGDAGELVAVLDRAFRTGDVARDRRVEAPDGGTDAWCCTAWPEPDHDGSPDYLVVELRATSEEESSRALQREVAERMLLSALRERDAAESAEASSGRATFLADTGRRLAGSLDEDTTLDTMTRLSLPQLGAWCIVDLLDDDGTMRRLAIIHPDPAKQGLARELEGRWAPQAGDAFGIPAALGRARTLVPVTDVEAVLGAAAHDPETLRILRQLGVGTLLTVPLAIRNRVAGAITFVAGPRDHAYTADDVALAEALAVRSALALDNARLHGEALALRAQAEEASRVKSAFLGTMSHELRTPLNAISGYVEILEMGLHGPVTEAQRTDLARIRRSQEHLTALVTDVLNLVRMGSGGLHYTLTDVAADEMIAAGVALVEPLFAEKGLLYGGVACEPGVTARADREKVTQIIVNLLSNAIKFTPHGGRVAIRCEADGHAVLVRVADTGLGIPPDKLADVFEPFVQVRSGLAGRDTGVGIGLSISRDLARGMGGDLTVESELGVGSTFTLRLPAAPTADARAA